ncbi:MAG: PAS domain S-box protein [Elusimicrobia bacterium]|nr:PAS domain S-box protein [Elusimicrobiota bacterium]
MSVADTCRAIFDRNPNPMVVYDESTLRILAVNDAMVARYGYTHDEFLAMNILDYRSQDEASRLSRSLATNPGDQNRGVWRHRTKSGELIEADVTTVRHLSEGRFVRISILRDVTGWNRALRELRDSERNWRRLFNAVADALVVIDVGAGRVLEMNDIALAMYGYSRDEAAGLPAAALCAEPGPILGGFADARRHRRKDGAEFPVEVRTSEIESEAGSRVVAAVRDVTARVESERLLMETETRLRQAQKMEAVGRLAGGIAHDFNNLLTAILGLSEMSIAALPVGHQVRADLEEIRRTGARAAALTGQLLAFSRRQVIEPRPFDLNDAVLSMAMLLRRVIGEHIELSVVPGPRPAVVRADPGQIEQLVMNLAVNARDAMSEGGKLTIEAGLVELDAGAVAAYDGLAAGVYARLVVSDTGPGVPAAARPHLFEPFFTTKEQGKGTGLGLATCYGIAKQNGGAIVCRSAGGQGASFEVLLPQHAAEISEPRAAVSAPTPRGTETVLIAEDEAPIRRLSTRILGALGYTVLEAPDGEEALEVLRGDRERRVRLALIDMVMPKLGGVKLAEAIALLRPDVRVLFTSGYTEDAIPGRAVFESGAEFLSKPYSVGQLGARIRATLDAVRLA